MHSYLALGLWKLAAVGIAVFLATTTAHAQTDEIQVYDAEINNPGQFSLQLHNNYTPIGRKEPDFPGESCLTIHSTASPNGPTGSSIGSNSVLICRFIRGRAADSA